MLGAHIGPPTNQIIVDMNHGTHPTRGKTSKRKLIRLVAQKKKLEGIKRLRMYQELPAATCFPNLPKSKRKNKIKTNKMQLCTII